VSIEVCAPSWWPCGTRGRAAPGTANRAGRPSRPHTLEEAYELADAIERGDVQHVRDELGDLLFQVVSGAHRVRNRGWFDSTT